tara:strand:+ start:147 stop:329 length:183 start_codon:yes stop_codon:yes gene_type:complete
MNKDFLTHAQKCINYFKHGVADGLINGSMKEGFLGHFYKQGYDFGLTLYYRLESESEDEN